MLDSAGAPGAFSWGAGTMPYGQSQFMLSEADQTCSAAKGTIDDEDDDGDRDRLV